MNKFASILLPLSAFLLFSCTRTLPSSSEESSSLEPTSSETSSTSSSSTSESTSTSEPTSMSSSTSEPPSSTSSSSASSSSSTSEAGYRLDPKNESLFANQGYLNKLPGLFDAWNEYRGDGQTIAVIDSGFDASHPEFVDEDGRCKVLETSAAFSNAGGRVSRVVGRDVLSPDDGDSHGTFCATVAAGSVTGSGTVGIAPNADLLLLKTDKKPQSIKAAFEYASSLGVKILTISIGSYSDWMGDLVNDGSVQDLTAEFDATMKRCHDAGMVICSAAGNGGQISGRRYEYTYPGASEYVIGAGGLSSANINAAWDGSSLNSSKKYQFCDVFAPAENIYSGCSYWDNGRQVLYGGGWMGTSFASPMIAGAAALYFQKNPSASNRDFETALFRSAIPFGNQEQTGYGRLNVEGLLSYEKGDSEIQIAFSSSSWWEADNAKTACFAWNYAQTAINGDYPGQLLSGSGTDKTLVIDSAVYDCLIFSRVSASGTEYWGAKTDDLPMSDFLTHRVFRLQSSPAWENDGQLAGGSFTD